MLVVPYKREEVQSYLHYAKSYETVLGSEARNVIIDVYLRLRNKQTPMNNTSIRITVRQLEALVRLSEAICRLHCETEVRPRHVRMATTLLMSSILTLTISSDNIKVDANYEKIREDVYSTQQAIVEKKIEEAAAFVLGYFSQKKVVTKHVTQNDLVSSYIERLYRKCKKTLSHEVAVNESHIVLKAIKRLLGGKKIVATAPNTKKKSDETEADFLQRKICTTKLTLPS